MPTAFHKHASVQYTLENALFYLEKKKMNESIALHRIEHNRKSLKSNAACCRLHKMRNWFNFVFYLFIYFTPKPTNTTEYEYINAILTYSSVITVWFFFYQTHIYKKLLL